MPEDGWDDREVTYHCDLCGRTGIHRSIYLNMDALIKMGLTQAEWALEIHRNDYHHYDEATGVWSA